MKHLNEKDLSLDKQVVSDLSGATDTRDETNDTNCASKVCTDSNFEICCAVSVEDTCPEKCPEVKTVDICPATNDSLCNVCSDAETCKCHITETIGCTVNIC